MIPIPTPTTHDLTWEEKVILVKYRQLGDYGTLKICKQKGTLFEIIDINPQRDFREEML